MKKKWIIFTAVGVGAVLIAISTWVMPYYAFIHTSQEINESYLSELLQVAGNTVSIPYVESLYMGWSCLLSFLIPVILVFSGVGFTFGFRMGEEGKEEDVKKELAKIKSEKSISVHGHIIEGYRAEEVENYILREGRMLQQGVEALRAERAAFDQRKSAHDEIGKKAAETTKQLEKLKQDHANRLDKINNLEKANKKLEEKSVDLDQQIVTLKRENLDLSKKLLAFEENSA